MEGTKTAKKSSRCTSSSSSRVETLDSPFVLSNVIDPHDEKQLVLVSNPEKKLFPYQLEGIKWLWRLHCQGEGGILGDDMGLGKTLQICTFIGSLIKSGLIKRALIVAPTTLLDNWCDEFDAVGVPAHLYYGTAKEKELNHVLKDNGILVTTYDTLVYNIRALSRLWNYVVLDEGHIIKNHKTKRSECVRQVPAEHRIVVTGTPIMNNIDEMWSLLNFCVPHKFPNLKNFQETRSRPILQGKHRSANPEAKLRYEDASKSIKKDIEAYHLRREKEKVLTLKKKHEFTVWLKLSSFQQYLYEEFVTHAGSAISQAPLAAITILKKVCDDPALLKVAEQPNEESEFREVKDDGASKRLLLEMENILQRCHVKNVNFESCKISFLKSFVHDMCRDGHHVLIFSHRKYMLSKIEDILKPHYKCGRLDGDTSSKNRTKTIKEFQAGTVQILLIMSTVGGVGITLTRADRVIVVDPAWNPSIDNQSICRAYRLGQENEVLVYRLITCGTAEEVIYKNQIHKVMLSKEVIEEETPYSYFSQKEIKAMFSISEGGFDISATQIQLANEHDHEITDPFVQTQMEFLNQAPQTAGITYHSLLFSKAAALEPRDVKVFKPTDITTHQNNTIQRLSRAPKQVHSEGSESKTQRPLGLSIKDHGQRRPLGLSLKDPGQRSKEKKTPFLRPESREEKQVPSYKPSSAGAHVIHSESTEPKTQRPLGLSLKDPGQRSTEKKTPFLRPESRAENQVPSYKPSSEGSESKTQRPLGPSLKDHGQRRPLGLSLKDTGQRSTEKKTPFLRPESRAEKQVPSYKPSSSGAHVIHSESTESKTQRPLGMSLKDLGQRSTEKKKVVLAGADHNYRRPYNSYPPTPFSLTPQVQSHEATPQQQPQAPSVGPKL